MTRSLLVVTGLTKEAGLAAGPGVIVIAGGGSRARLEEQLGRTDPGSVGAVLSFGLAGGLDPILKVGDLIVGRSVVSGGTRVQASEMVVTHLRRRLDAGGVPYREVDTAGSDVPLLGVDEKAALRKGAGAAAVDMESHVAAAWAGSNGLPFGMLRAISDDARHALPPLAGRAMRPDGSVDLFAVLTGLARHPTQFPALVRTGRDAAIAFRRLRGVRGLLGRGLGFDL